MGIRLAAVAAAFSILVASAADPAAAAPPALPVGPVGGRLRDYVSALNDGDPAVAARFATEDLAPGFGQPHEPSAVQRFFSRQRRVTGGIEALGFRFEDAAETKGVFAFRDGIYGGLRAIAFTFDATPARRITDFTFVSAPDWAASTAPKLTPDEAAARAADRIERGCRADVFSGAFLVAHRGKVLVQRACGEASKRYHAPNDVGTRFNLGSMNKMFTAVAAAQLIEQGRLSLSDPLNAYLDDAWLPKSVLDQLTVGELFSMTSGIEDYFHAAPFGGFQMNRTLDAYKPVIRGLKLVSKPGEKFAYSDTAYFLLGLVVQKASGEDYYAYIRKHIYGPAGMTSTDSYPLDGPEQNLATGYFYIDPAKAWFENRSGVPLRGTPDGGGYSTVSDMLRFALALTSGKLLKPASVELLFKDRVPPSGTGFYVLDGPAGRIVGKDGAGLGISAEMDIYLDAGWVVVSLSNYDDGARAPLEAMRADIAAAQ
jgi:CubicO group peptidase (beta-lactamase class C family)